MLHESYHEHPQGLSPLGLFRLRKKVAIFCNVVRVLVFVPKENYKCLRKLLLLTYFSFFFSNF